MSSTTGHENEAINVQGLKASLQKFKTDFVDGKAAKATTLQGYGITDAYTKNETYTKTEVNGLVSTPHQNYVTVATYASLPASGSADTIYRVSSYDGANSQVDDTVYSEYAWDGTQYVFLDVKSQIGEVFDITVYNSNTKYANLSAALGIDGANIPQSLRRGGMSIKYVCSSNNKYVQYRLMADEWSATESDWQGVDDEPILGSENLVKSEGVKIAINNLAKKINYNYLATTLNTRCLTQVGNTVVISSYIGRATSEYVEKEADYINVYGVTPSIIIFVDDNNIVVARTSFTQNMTWERNATKFLLQFNDEDNVNGYNSLCVSQGMTIQDLFDDSFRYIVPLIEYNISKTGKLNKSFLLEDEFKGKNITVVVTSGLQDNRYRIYGCNDNGTLNTSIILVDYTNDGKVSSNFVVPQNGYIWVYTVNNTDVMTDYQFCAYMSENFQVRFRKDEAQISKIGKDVDGNILYEKYNQSPDLTARLSRLIDLSEGNVGEDCFLIVNSEYYKDIQSKITLYGCTDSGQIDTSITITTGYVNDEPCKFKIPNNKYVWLFTSENTGEGQLIKYDILVSSYPSVRGEIADLNRKFFNLQNQTDAETLKGKTVVCFGDSITEFHYQGKSYTDYLSEITNANVINVGVGGSRLAQRSETFYEVFDQTKQYEVDDYCIYDNQGEVRIYKFVNQHLGAWNSNDVRKVSSGEAYGNLDIVNMVKAACGYHSYEDMMAAANVLKQAVADDNTAIIARLFEIDWQKVSYVTIFAGTNDWNKGTLIGQSGSVNINTTLGSINVIIEYILRTYPHVKLYWFTPIIRVLVPEFSSSAEYNIGDVCEYSNANYRFINQHQGAWDANDVVQISAYEARKPEYFSDYVEINGLTLREFSADIYNEVELNHIAVCDMYNTLGWNRYNFSKYFLDYDGTHPYKGFRQIAEKIKKFIYSN